MRMSLHIPVFFIIIMLCVSCFRPDMNSDVNEERLPVIYPDYTGIHIPRNIAPLNFRIEEAGKKYVVRFSSSGKSLLTLKTTSGDVRIPEKKWKKILEKNRGNELIIEIAVKRNDNKWVRYSSIVNTISEEPIDPYIVYRKINPSYIYWHEMSIVQRNVESFEESDVMNNKLTKHNCVNCHSFQSNNPEKMILHLRKDPSGTVLVNNGEMKILDTKTPYTLSSFVYPSWHPTKNYIAFTTNNIRQSFNGTGHDQHHVYDLASDIVIYDVEQNSVFTSPKIATLNYENLPSWSPDGKYLYFICFENIGCQPSDSLVKYDLMGISFNPETKEFGEVDTLIKSSESGKSMSFPVASPDGKYLLFNTADYGYFVVGSISTDICLMNLKTKEISRPDFNSDYTDSYHAWSKNGRWIMFSSKRDDGLTSIPYFCYFSENGKSTKPFPLPQKDPGFYETYNWNFNRPEFITGPVKMPEEKMVKELYTANHVTAYFDTLLVDMDAISGATKTDVADARKDIGKEYMKN